MKEKGTKPLPAPKHSNRVDLELLRNFEESIGAKVPHVEKQGGRGRVLNATPLVDLTDLLRECASLVYGLDLSEKEFKAFGKLESKILSGSVKVRPMVQIVEDAIRGGRLSSGQPVFEATSGNFGISLGLLADLGLDVIVLVSRKLQEGVFEELQGKGVKAVNLDVDICPAPGMKVDLDALTVKAVSANIRNQLNQFGLDPTILDASRREVEELLARQDVIDLAKLLARIYGGFCPEQYDNELNVMAHETVTAPEIDQQLSSMGYSLGEFEVVCTFGTGGTSGGLSRYIEKKYGKKSVRTVFPLSNQDVAGIRTKEKASGLRFYEPERYAGQHEVDFEPARRLLGFFVGKGLDIGESSALALYSVLQMVNFGLAEKFVVILADGSGKYEKPQVEGGERSLEATLEEVTSNIGNYTGVLWTHGMFVPREEGIRVIANSLGVGREKIRVAKVSDVGEFINSGEAPEGLTLLLRESGERPLLVCMSGSTSLRVAQLLGGEVEAVSLTGGITKLSETGGAPLARLVQPSRA
jgi:cysteine synthase A